MILHILDLACLWGIWWVAFALLVGGHEVRNWRSLLLSAGLILVMGAAFTGAISAYVYPSNMMPWMRGMVYGIAIVGAWVYDYRFGVDRHIRMARQAALDLWRRAHRRRA